MSFFGLYLLNTDGTKTRPKDPVPPVSKIVDFFNIFSFGNLEFLNIIYHELIFFFLRILTFIKIKKITGIPKNNDGSNLNSEIKRPPNLDGSDRGITEIPILDTLKPFET